MRALLAMSETPAGPFLVLGQPEGWLGDAEPALRLPRPAANADRLQAAAGLRRSPRHRKSYLWLVLRRRRGWTGPYAKLVQERTGFAGSTFLAKGLKNP